MSKLEQRIDTWLTLSESNAAGRLGLYRIIFAVSYFLLFSTSIAQFTQITATPANAWYPTPVLLWMTTPPSESILTILVIINTFALVCLAIGWRVRLMTLLVLVSGMAIGALSASVGGKVDHSRTFREVYIPLFMLFAPWGDTFSLDSVLKIRRGHDPVDPSLDTFRYSWVFKALLWLLALMFMIGGILKAMPPGQWLTDFDLMRKLMLDHNRSLQDYFRYIIASLPLVPLILQLSAVMFESFYPLVLINKTWRRLYLSMSVFFHIGTKISLNIWFFSMLFLYLFFFDIYGVYRRFFPHRLLKPLAHVLDMLPSWALVIIAWIVAIVATSARNTPIIWNAIAGVINIHDIIWMVAVILGLYGILTACIRLYQNRSAGRLFSLDG